MSSGELIINEETIIPVSNQISTIIKNFGPNSGLRMVTPQAGCPEGCIFCSQNAASSTIVFNEKGLELVFSAINKINGHISYLRSNNVNPVITSHYDNDVGSYTNLDDYLRWVSKIGAVSRLSTVGWSRTNKELQTMHNRIVSDPNLSTAIHKLRFSFQPFTRGARGANGLTLQETLNDITNALMIYRPFIESRSNEDVVIELRYNPNVVLTEVNSGENQIRFGPYSIVTINDLTDTEAGYQKGNCVLKGPEYEHPIEATLYILENADGIFYEIKTKKDSESKIGIERSIQIFPVTKHRQDSGYVEGTRFFREYLEIVSKDNSISWENISEALSGIDNFAKLIQPGNPELANLLYSNVLPWTLQYVQCIYNSGLQPEFVCRDPGNAIGHETILNHGRANRLFNGLAQSRDTAMSLFEHLNYHSNYGTIGSELPQVRISPHPNGIIVALHDSSTFKVIESQFIEIEGISKKIIFRQALKDGLLIGSGGSI